MSGLKTLKPTDKARASLRRNWCRNWKVTDTGKGIKGLFHCGIMAFAGKGNGNQHLALCQACGTQLGIVPAPKDSDPSIE
ncbi:MAG: hypothetical protein V1756_00125 [Patescibacteria group bacterium]